MLGHAFAFGCIYGLILWVNQCGSRAEEKLALLLLLLLACSAKKKYLGVALISAVRLCAAPLRCQRFNPALLKHL